MELLLALDFLTLFKWYEDPPLETPAGDGEPIVPAPGSEALLVVKPPIVKMQDGLAALEPVAPVAAPVVAPPVVEPAVVVPPTPGTPEIPATDAAAEALAAELRKMPGVVGDLIKGSTVAEVAASLAGAKAAYTSAHAQVLREQGERVPGARGGGGGPAIPTTPIGKMQAGFEAHDARVQKK